MSLFYDWDLFNSVNSLKTNLMKGVRVSWGKYWSKPCLNKTDSLRPHSIYYKVKPSDPSSVFTKHFQVTGNKPARCYVDHLCTVTWDKLKNFVVHIIQTLWWISCQHFLVNHLEILLSTQINTSRFIIWIISVLSDQFVVVQFYPFMVKILFSSVLGNGNV